VIDVAQEMWAEVLVRAPRSCYNTRLARPGKEAQMVYTLAIEVTSA